MHKSRNTVRVILTANSTIEPYSENILEGKTEEQQAQLMSDKHAFSNQKFLRAFKYNFRVKIGVRSLRCNCKKSGS